jgi:cellulose synthase/poly-beta-1,6-N-acetylglucosamine synthase-like glycosyltransferase
LIVTPSLDSFSARLLRSNWTEWRPENRYYFDERTIQAALSRTGFDRARIQVDRRSYSVEHLATRARTSPPSWLTRTLTLTYDVVPHSWGQRAHLQLPASGMVVTARRKAQSKQPLLSVVMPVFNERRTFEPVLDRGLAKRLDGLDKEVILVESNSTDGTRDAVLRYKGQPGVTVILQGQPRGKGNAVREGLTRARGDFILIQDADDEYDVNDYDALLEPLKNGTHAFVLGSRHAAGWKIREFNDQPLLAAFFNFGHVVFLGLFNMLYGQMLTDPFTMYKVFRRDCLQNIHLECDRFDFDFELVIKLIRSGYHPAEIPVNYRARSFSEGKKVSVVRDPLTWIRALLKYRLSPIGPPPKH